jgi:type III secretory pathway component EscU
MAGDLLAYQEGLCCLELVVGWLIGWLCGWFVCFLFVRYRGIYEYSFNPIQNFRQLKSI